MEIVTLLEAYGAREPNLACQLAAKWIRSEVEHSKERGIAAIQDPSVQSLIREAQLGISCGVRPVFTPKPTTIMGYFQHTSARPSSLPVSEAPTLPPKRPSPPASISPPPSPPRSTVSASSTPPQVVLFSDGACSSNGRKGAKAGYGVTMGVILGTTYRELANTAAPLNPSESQTNQRAELRGVSKAWEIATTQLPGILHKSDIKFTVVHIYTDSQYSLDCILKWALAWSKKGWKKRDGDDVLHQDLIEPLFQAVQTWKRESHPYTIEFHHVNSHTGKTDPISLGNARADELATGTIA